MRLTRTPTARPPRARPIAIFIALTAAIGSVLAVGAPAHRASAAASGAVFEAVAPARVADTRRGDCGCTEVADGTIRVPIANRAGVPADATAVAISLTVTATTGAGYATVWPTGSTMPGTSTINWGAGQTRANGAIVALGANGAIDVFVSSPADVVVDVTGAFTTAAGPVSAGRFSALTPQRVLDTRSGSRPATGRTVVVGLPAGVPDDATALAVTITATDAAGWGYVSAYPARAARPASSVVNTDQPGQTRAATAIVPVSEDGLELYVDGGSHLLVDVYGWFSGPSSDPGDDGLFVANAPTRVWDTRQVYPVWTGGTEEPFASPAFPGSAQLTWELADRAAAVVFNLTVVDTPTAGWMTAYPSRTERPDTSTINWAGDDTVANLGISPWSASPQWGVAFYADQETDILVDVTGYFTGEAVPAPLPAPTNDSPGYTGEPASDLVRDSVPGTVFAVLGGVEMQTLPTLPSGAAGIASTPPERIRFAELIYEYRRRVVARSVAAHEVGHILTYRWVAAGNPESRVVGLDAGGGDVNGYECLAEAIGRLLFVQQGRYNYASGYGGTYDACAATPAAQGLASEVVDATT